jgi:glycosyltransferase involved in cell wall biosynthesis
VKKRLLNIVMMTNSYKPFVGGVERSIETFSDEFKVRGHRVLIVAPTFKNMMKEKDVLRVPAIQKFNGTDFSVPLPIYSGLFQALKAFKPDIVHAHHPYLIGDTAVRIAARFKIPIVFTFHTFFEDYTHYVPGNSAALKRFVSALATGFANMCNSVIAPSESVLVELKKRGVTAPIDVAPTGIDLKKLRHGDRNGFREKTGIPRKAFTAGLISRLAPEKNIGVVAESAALFLEQNPDAHFLVVGTGPLLPFVKDLFKAKGLAGRLHTAGVLKGKELADAYHALDVFTFASKTETQGMVLAEAMAAGVPVLAIDAPAVRDIMVDRVNGVLLKGENRERFAASLSWFSGLSAARKKEFSINARKTALRFSKERCAAAVLKIYSSLLDVKASSFLEHKPKWEEAKRFIKAELEIIANMASATEAAFKEN